MSAVGQKQLLHLVFGGELTSLDSVEFKNLSELDIVGIYPSYARSLQGLEGVRAAHCRQRADAVFHRPHAQAARPRLGEERPGRVSDGPPVPAVGDRCCYSRRMIVLISRVTKPSALNDRVTTSGS